MNFAENYIKTSLTPIHFITSKDVNGDDCYFFLMAPTHKIKQLKTITTGQIDLTEYGVIVASGFGKSAPQEVIEKLKTEYNYQT